MWSRVRSMIARLRSPRKSIFNSPSFSIAVASYWVTMGASSSEALGPALRCTGTYSEHRPLGDHHGSGVDAVLASLVDETLGDVDHVGHFGVRLVERAQFGGFDVAALVAGHRARSTPASGRSWPITSGGMALAIWSPSWGG